MHVALSKIDKFIFSNQQHRFCISEDVRSRANLKYRKISDYTFNIQIVLISIQNV